MAISTLEAMKKANKQGQSKDEADRLISLYLDIPIDQVRSTPREEYDQLYTRMMERMNIEPEEKQEDSDSFREEFQPMKNQQTQNMDKSKIGIDLNLAPKVLFDFNEKTQNKKLDIQRPLSDEQRNILQMLLAKSFQLNDNGSLNEPQPMVNEQMILENPKIKGMDYYLAVEPIQKQIQDLQIQFNHKKPLSDGERNILQMFLAKQFDLKDTGSFREEPQPMKNEQTQNTKIKPEQFDLKDTGSFDEKKQNKIKEPQIKKKHKPLDNEQRNFIRNRLWNQYYWPVLHISYDTVQYMTDEQLIDNYNRIFDADL